MINRKGAIAYAIGMKRKLLDILACPVCKYHPLELEVTKEDDKEIVEGRLRCPKCEVDYPIEDGIPNMLPPEGK
ncbi:MAG: methytransferase partner Trm112 [Methanomassiliicoccales archaeon]|nr:methytransferase partner Trm112 [Methanomassiliicoccales archaeon]